MSANISTVLAALSTAAAGVLSRKPDALDQRRKALIGPQRVESGFDIEQRHLPVPCVNRPFEPFEGSIGLAKADVQEGNAHGRRVPWFQDAPQLVELGAGLELASRPSQEVLFDGGDPGVQDTGLIFLGDPVPGITPSKLAPPNILRAVERLQTSFDVNVPMAFAGSGTRDYNGGNFEYSRSRRIGVFTFDRIQDEQWASWNKGPSSACYGDSGAPIFVQVGSQERIVGTVSDAGDTCTEEETHARVDTKYVQDWIKDTIAAR